MRHPCVGALVGQRGQAPPSPPPQSAGLCRRLFATAFLEQIMGRPSSRWSLIGDCSGPTLTRHLLLLWTASRNVARLIVPASPDTRQTGSPPAGFWDITAPIEALISCTNQPPLRYNTTMPQDHNKNTTSESSHTTRSPTGSHPPSPRTPLPPIRLPLVQVLFSRASLPHSSYAPLARFPFAPNSLHGSVNCSLG